jgi:hypothetical protein
MTRREASPSSPTALPPGPCLSLVAVRLPGANVYDDPAVEFVVGGEMTCGFWEGESGRESWWGPHGKQGTWAEQSARYTFSYPIYRLTT